MNELWMFIVSIAVLGVVITGGCIIKKKQKKRKWFISRIFLAGFFAATLIWCFGYLAFFEEELVHNGVMVFCIAVQNTLRIFAMDFDYDFFKYIMDSGDAVVDNICAAYTSLLLVAAPILTASVILSFFNETVASLKIFFNRKKEIYVFSELNQEALSIAGSCIEKAAKERQKILVVFTDVYKDNIEHLAEMLEAAHAMDAICVKKDILALNYFSIFQKQKCEFFIIGKNEKENMKHVQELVNRYGENEKVRVYLFSEDVIEKMLVNAMITPEMKMSVRCINIKQNTIYNYLYEDSCNKNIIYQYAVKKKEKGSCNLDTEKEENVQEVPIGTEGREWQILSIGIAGNNGYARELLKGLLWYGQMDKYELRLHVFDEDGSIENELKSECPELMKKNCRRQEGDAEYQIKFYRQIPGTKEYYKVLKKISQMTSLYLMYEDEKKNIKIGIESDRVLKKKDRSSVTNIVCLVCDGTKKRFIQKGKLKDYKKNVYNLDYMYQQWDYDSIYNSELEMAALDEHLKWDMKPKFNPQIEKMSEKERAELQKDKTEDFYKYDYFYRSSIARVIRVKLRAQMNVKGARKPLKDRDVEERRLIREIEHRGWNAYMRTEGYSYGEKKDEILKLHSDLVPFYKLPPDEQEKDDD